MDETPPPFAAPAPATPEPLAADRSANRRYFLPGCGVLVVCLEAGEWINRTAGLTLPGSIIGLFLLLALLGTGLVPLHWVESAARLLLWLLPFLFLPIFILAMRDQAFWAVQGRALCGAVILGMTLLWVVTGPLAQFLLKIKAADKLTKL